MPSSLRLSSGIRIGFLAALVGVLVILLAGLVAGRGGSLLTEAGARMLPESLAASTGLSTVAAYLAVHTAFYLVAGMAAVLLTRVADRANALMTGLILVIIIIEFSFLEFSTMALAQRRIDIVAWRAVLIAHAAADLVFALLLFRAHPRLLGNLRRGYQA